MKERIHQYIKLDTSFYSPELIFIGTSYCPHLSKCDNDAQASKIAQVLGLNYRNGIIYCHFWTQNNTKCCPHFDSATNAFVVCNNE